MVSFYAPYFLIRFMTLLYNDYIILKRTYLSLFKENEKTTKCRFFYGIIKEIINANKTTNTNF